MGNRKKAANREKNAQGHPATRKPASLRSTSKNGEKHTSYKKKQREDTETVPKECPTILRNGKGILLPRGKEP